MTKPDGDDPTEARPSADTVPAVRSGTRDLVDPPEEDVFNPIPSYDFGRGDSGS